MTLKDFMTLHALIIAVLGLAFFLLPAGMLSLFGVLTLGTAAGIPARLIGAAFIAFAIMSWTSQDTSNGKEGWGVVLGLMIFYILAFIVFLISQLAGIWNVLGWLLTLLCLIFAIGFGYYLNRKVQALS